MAFLSQFPDVAIPDSVSLPDYMLSHCAKYGDKVVFVDHLTEEALTYSELAKQVQLVAANLCTRGLRRGDVFGIYAPNHPQWMVAFLGIMMAGGVVMTANPNYTSAELAHQVKGCKAKYMLTVPSLVGNVMATGWPLQEVFAFGSPPDATAFATLLTPTSAPVPRFTMDPKTELAMLPFSSGTTSLPKAVRITHYNAIANLCQMDCPHVMDFTAQDTLMLVLPLFHAYGLNVVALMGMVKGCTMVTFPRFEPQVFLEGLQKHRVTVAHVAPPLIQFLAKSPMVQNYDLSSLRTVFSAAAPLGLELAQTLVNRLKCTLRQAYGMTELSPLSHMTPFKSQHKYNSIGCLLPNMSLKIMDPETGLAVRPGERGEFWLSGPNVMMGYLNDAGATAATIDADGYIHTGDVGYMDADGDCYIVDRCKELIKVKGFQVAPAELEDLLQGHPAVQDCAVIGIPVGEDERPKAFIVLKPGSRPDHVMAEDIMAYVKQRVAPYKRLAKVVFTQTIPKSASGKILRRELRAGQSKL